MSDRIMVNPDDDLYEEVLRRHRETGVPKSKIANQMMREGFESDANGEPAFMRTLGEGLFVAGAVLGLINSATLGVGVLLFGLGIMLWSSMQRYLHNGMGYANAFKATMGFL